MLKVFLVDDEPYILNGLISIIDWSEYGLEIAGQARSGDDTLKCLESCGGADILVTDIAMPEMNGLQLIRRVKELYPETRYVVLSGYNDFEYVKEGIKLGIENYLLKPVNVSEFISTIENIIAKFKKPTLHNAFIEKDLEILNNNILYRWVSNNIDFVDLKERAEILQINLEYSSYLVSAVRVLFNEDANPPLDRKQQLQAISRVYEQLKKLLSPNFNSTCFCDFDNDIIIIFGDDAYELDKSHLYRALLEACAKLQEIPEASLLITAGDIQHNYKNVHNSYVAAKKFLEYQLINAEDKIIDFEYVQEFTSASSTAIEIDYEAFSLLLAKEKRNETCDFIDKAFKKLTDSKNINPSDVINYSVEMILHINRTVNEFEKTGKSGVGDYKNILSAVLKLQTVEQLLKYVKNIADSAIDSFNSGNRKQSPIIRQILNYTNEHYNENLCLKSLGAIFNINPAYLGQLFQKETDELYTDYLNKLKMKKARQMLLDTNLKIADISREVGFCNANYFCTQFKKYIGVSPSEIRECKI